MFQLKFMLMLMLMHGLSFSSNNRPLLALAIVVAIAGTDFGYVLCNSLEQGLVPA